MELNCWALWSGGSTALYVVNEELQFQNPLLRWHDMTHCIFPVWEVGGPLPCLQLATHDSQCPKETWWPRDGMTWSTMSLSGKLWKKCWWGWPMMSLFEVTGAYLEMSCMHGLMRAPWRPVWCWRDIVTFWWMHAGFVQQMTLSI